MYRSGEGTSCRPLRRWLHLTLMILQVEENIKVGFFHGHLRSGRLLGPSASSPRQQTRQTSRVLCKKKVEPSVSRFPQSAQFRSVIVESLPSPRKAGSAGLGERRWAADAQSRRLTPRAAAAWSGPGANARSPRARPLGNPRMAFGAPIRGLPRASEGRVARPRTARAAAAARRQAWAAEAVRLHRSGASAAPPPRRTRRCPACTPESRRPSRSPGATDAHPPRGAGTDRARGGPSEEARAARGA